MLGEIYAIGSDNPPIDINAIPCGLLFRHTCFLAYYSFQTTKIQRHIHTQTPEVRKADLKRPAFHPLQAPFSGTC